MPPAVQVLDALMIGAAAAPAVDGVPPPSAIELVWWGLDPASASRTGIVRLHGLLAWLDRVDFWPDLRAAFEDLHDVDEALGDDRGALIARWSTSEVSRTVVPDELVPGTAAAAMEQELAALIRQERTVAVARRGRAADGYLCLFDALLIGLDRLNGAGAAVPDDVDAAVATVTYVAAHPWVPISGSAPAPVPSADVDAWRRACGDDPELERALRLTEDLRRRCPDDHRWLLSVLGCGFAWLPLPASA
jgi:hypothetical protein